MNKLSYSALAILVLAGCGGGDAFGTGGSGGADASAGGASTGGGGNGGSAGSSTGGNSTDGGASGGSAGSGTGGGVSIEGGTADAQGDACVPANFEICGDLRDNNCDGKVDENCNGLGTFVSALTGNDANPGTVTQPVKTIAVGMAHAQTIPSPAVFVADGKYGEKVTVVDGVSLYGGFSCPAQPCTWTRDVQNFVSEIDATDFEGMVINHNVTRATNIDGFTIVGLSGDTTNGISPGTAAVTILGGAPTITRNVIRSGTLTGGTYAFGSAVGIAILTTAGANTAGPRIEGNDIQGGSSTFASIGVLFAARPNVTGPTYGLVTRNVINGGLAANGSIGLAAWTSDPSVLIEQNVINGGDSTSQIGTSWGVAVSSALTLNRNMINVTKQPGCSSALAWCGGILSQSSTTTITNNVIVGASATWSAGVSLIESERPAGAVILNSNTINGGSVGALATTAAIRLNIGSCTTCGFNGFVGKIRNNILTVGTGGARWGVYEDPTGTGQTEHPVALENNQFYVPNPGTADGLYRYVDSAGTVTKMTLLSDVNNLGTLNPGITPVGSNQSGDPLVDSTLHLQLGSPCIDKGTSTEAPSGDMEGDPRPIGNGFDIGADESGG